MRVLDGARETASSTLINTQLIHQFVINPFTCDVKTSELEDRTKENRHAAMKSIIMQRATHCSVLQFDCIPTN